MFSEVLFLGFLIQLWEISKKKKSKENSSYSEQETVEVGWMPISGSHMNETVILARLAKIPSNLTWVGIHKPHPIQVLHQN